jgi:putative FmdB family regulatory protein
MAVAIGASPEEGESASKTFIPRVTIMPIYEFRCDHCQHVFELLAVQSDDLVSVVCPACQSPEISRVLSRVNIGSSSGGGKALPEVSERSCASGTCSTIDIPGPSR